MPVPIWTYDEHEDGDKASTDVKAGQKLNRQWEMTTNVFPAISAQAIAALYALSGVQKGSPHPQYPYALCTTIDADRHADHPYFFTVRATYEEPTPQPGQPVNPEKGQPKPDDRPPQYSVSFRKEDGFRLYDVDYEPVENSAGDPFTDPPPIPVTR